VVFVLQRKMSDKSDILVGNKGLSSRASQGKTFSFGECLASHFGQSRKTTEINCRFLNALGSRPLLSKEKTQSIRFRL